MCIDNTIVVYNSEEIFQINEDLLTSQDAWDNIERINALHVELLELGDMMVGETSTHRLQKLDIMYTTIEFDLQRAWKFHMEMRFHKFWKRPKCTCPKMDNNDRYPYGSYIVSGDCPLHGEQKEEK